MNRSELLPPLPEAEWSTALSAELTGKILNIHRMIAHNPALMNAYAPLRNYIVAGSSLTNRQRELLILRIGHRMDSEYEWIHHVIRGRAAGLSAAEIERVRSGSAADGWPAEWSMAERFLLQAVDEMHQTQELTIETAAALQLHIGTLQLLDTIFTIGTYITLGTILKTFDVPMEETIMEEFGTL